MGKKRSSKEEEKDDIEFSGMLKNGVHYLSGEIKESNVKPAIEFILNASLDPKCKHEHLTLVITSEGGYTSDGFALVDIMMGSRIPVRTVGLGEICSMGLLIFLSGEQGTRMLTPNCVILSHQWSGGSHGKEHELVAAQKFNDITTELVMRHYIRTTGLDKRSIREKLLPPHDVWFTAQEAKKLGICDQVKDLRPAQLKG